MYCELLYFNGDNKCMNKDTNVVATLLDIKPYRPVNDLEGSIILNGDYPLANYCKLIIANKEKYFYITDRTTDTAGRLHLHLREDVLMTHAGWITTQRALLRRSFAYGNDYLPAGYPCLAYSKISHNSSSELSYGTSNTPPAFILVTAGRGYQPYKNIKDAMTSTIPVN